MEEKETSNHPFASVASLCHVSSSQEEHLRRCRFLGEPDDDEALSSGSFSDIPVALTGIVMVSPPESSEENENAPRDTDVFHTPPEEAMLAVSQEQQQQQTVAVDNDGNRTVDGVENEENITAVDGNCGDDDTEVVKLWRDTELGFSAELELTQKSVISPGVNEVNRCEFMNVSDLCGSAMKKIIPMDGNLRVVSPEVCLGSEMEKMSDRLVKSTEKLKSSSKKSKLLDSNLSLEASKDVLGAEKDELGKAVANSNCLESTPNHQIEEDEEVSGGNREAHVDSSAKRKLDFYGRALEFEFEVGKVEANEANGLCNSKDRHSDAKSPGKQKDNGGKSIDYIDKFRCVSPKIVNSGEKQKDVIDGRTRRELPVSLCRNDENAGGEAMSVDVQSLWKEVTLLDVLRVLAEDHNYDPSLEKISVVEAAKRRGMTFP